MVGTGPAVARTFSRAAPLGASFARQEVDVALGVGAAPRGVVGGAGLVAMVAVAVVACSRTAVTVRSVAMGLV